MRTQLALLGLLAILLALCSTSTAQAYPVPVPPPVALPEGDWHIVWDGGHSAQNITSNANGTLTVFVGMESEPGGVIPVTIEPQSGPGGVGTVYGVSPKRYFYGPFQPDGRYAVVQTMTLEDGTELVRSGVVFPGHF